MSRTLSYTSALPLDEQRVERVLSVARAMLAMSLLTAIYVTPPSGNFDVLSQFIFPAYCIYSLGLLVFCRLRTGTCHAIRLATHIADILWTGGLMVIFSQSFNGPIVVFLVFPLVAAAMRWGFRAAMITSLATIGVLFIVVWTVNNPTRLSLEHAVQIERSRVSVGVVSLAIMGFLLGYLGEHERTLRGEMMAVARLGSQAHNASTSDETIAALFGEIFDKFEVACLQLAIHQRSTGTLDLWESKRAEDGMHRLSCQRLDLSVHDSFLFEDTTHYIAGTATAANGRSLDANIYDHFGKKLGNRKYNLHDSWLPPHFKSLISVPFFFGDEWEMRLFLWDANTPRRERKVLRAAIDFADRHGPVFFTAALQQHLRSQATAEERARISRELHDGVMQTLVGLDLKIQSIRNESARGGSSDPQDLVQIQEALRRETSNMRSFIKHNRTLDIGPAHLIPFLAETLSRFQAESGIRARFICDVEQANLPRSTCYEVWRIVQEALTNTRKHSGAENVIVRLARHHGKWVLIVSDDGRGFDFVGRHTLAELDTARAGPTVIKDRVRGLSGDLVIESSQDRGARLEITFAGRGDD